MIFLCFTKLLNDMQAAEYDKHVCTEPFSPVSVGHLNLKLYSLSLSHAFSLQFQSFLHIFIDIALSGV